MAHDILGNPVQYTSQVHHHSLGYEDIARLILLISTRMHRCTGESSRVVTLPSLLFLIGGYASPRKITVVVDPQTL